VSLKSTEQFVVMALGMLNILFDDTTPECTTDLMQAYIPAQMLLYNKRGVYD